MIVTDTFEYRNTLLFRQELGVDRRIRQPKQNGDADKDGQSSEENEDDLVRDELRSGVKRDTVGYEAAEYLRHAVLNVAAINYHPVHEGGSGVTLTMK